LSLNKTIQTTTRLWLCASGGDKVPRKGGPGITQSDMLVINKTDLAAAVGADLKVRGLLCECWPIAYIRLFKTTSK